MTAEGTTFTKTFSEIAAGKYQFKVFEVGKGDEGWHGRGKDNVIIDVTEASDLTITYDSATGDITVSGTKVTEVKNSIEIENMFAVGDGDEAWLNGVSWDPASEKNKMTEKDGVYTITYKGVVADQYQVKFVANGDKTAWEIQWGTEEGAEEGVAVKGSNPDSIKFKVESKTGYGDVTLTFDATKLNKEDGTGATYKIDVVEGEKPEEPTTVPETTEAVEVTTTATEADTTATEPEGDTTSTEATEADTTATQAEGDTTATEADTTATQAEGDTTATQADTTATEADTTATEEQVPVVPGFYVVGSKEALGDKDEC